MDTGNETSYCDIIANGLKISSMMMKSEFNNVIYDHLSMPLPFPISEDVKGVQGVVLDILEAAEDLVDDYSQDEEEVMSLEPTPLGPQGIGTIVHEVPLTESAGVLLQNNEMNYDALFDALNPLLRAGPAPQADYCVSKRGLTTTFALPSPKSERRRVSATAEETFSSTNALIFDTPQLVKGQEEECNDEERFRAYQFDQWKDRFQDLVEFRQKNGHCLVPHNFPENHQLSQWTNRQRYQHKLKQTNRHSTLTDERQTALENMGFVWKSHKAAWIERFESLKQFRAQHGHCSVPSNCADRSLAIWVKCQRRQYKLYYQGAHSTMTDERFAQLDRLGFSWNPRNLKLAAKTSCTD
jgi:hypothetical protein